MKLNSIKRGFCSAAIAAMVAVTSLTFALAETITVTDIAGRTVEVEKNPSKVVIGEGRMIYSIALLDQDNPFQRVVGWKDDMIKFDPDAYRKYQAQFPGAADIPNFGSPYTDEWNLEAVIALDTELVLMKLGNLLKAQESGIIEKLEAGVATVFVDFRQDPTQNTIPSIQLLGRIFDHCASHKIENQYGKPEWLKHMSKAAGLGSTDNMSGMRALDLACGTGEISRILCALGAEVTGVDFSEDMLAIAG